MMDGMAGGMVLWMLLAALIIAGGLTFAVVGGSRVVKDLIAGRSHGPPALGDRTDAEQAAEQPSALEQAQERYVRGEIDHAELERLLDGVLRDDQTGLDR